MEAHEAFYVVQVCDMDAQVCLEFGLLYLRSTCKLTWL